MSVPHVTGAIARYLAANPGTEPERMRRLVQAAGRLDWAISSDPGWDGPNDSTGPRRLLDVGALLGPAGLRAWVVPGGFVAAADTPRRRARFDIQRLGGYDGDITLDLDGLPAAVGNATFEPATLDLGDLGGRLTIAVDGDASDGRY